MLKPISKKYCGLITISGPTKSGKSQLAEYLISEQKSINYIATSKPRENDQDWTRRISIHRRRRPESWKLIEYPNDICKAIESIDKHETILIDSLGGLVEQHLIKNDAQWKVFETRLVKYLTKKNNYGFIVVIEEIGWGVVPSTPIGNLFRERLSKLSKLLSRNAIKRWLAVNGTAIDLDRIGYHIP